MHKDTAAFLYFLWVFFEWITHVMPVCGESNICEVRKIDSKVMVWSVSIHTRFELYKSQMLPQNEYISYFENGSINPIFLL